MLEFKDYLINELGYTPDREDHNHFSTADGKSLRLKLDPPKTEIPGQDYPIQFIFGLDEANQGVKVLGPWLCDKVVIETLDTGFKSKTYYPMSDVKQYRLLKYMGNEGFLTYVKYINNNI